MYLILCQQSGEFTLLKDYHVLLYGSYLRHDALQHYLLTDVRQNKFEWFEKTILKNVFNVSTKNANRDKTDLLF